MHAKVNKVYPPHRASAAITIGAATLADIYDPEVRGKKVGVNTNYLSMTDISV